MQKREYLNILKEELIPAMGCTEPIAVAYCAALAAAELTGEAEKITIEASPNIIKNVKSVVVPNTGGRQGLATAAAAGILAGCPEKELQILTGLSEDDAAAIDAFVSGKEIAVKRSDRPFVFDIRVTVRNEAHSATAEIAGHHTNVVYLSSDDRVLKDTGYEEAEGADDIHTETDRSLLNIAGIVAFADSVPMEDIRDLIARQIAYNTAIAEEGLTRTYGANIGQILMKAYGDTVHNRAKAYAAAGSDARMSGSELPVVINSGSGNQGITASLPVIVYAKELGVSEETLYRALVVSNLVTIHLKTGIGRLSAYCGATSAGCGAGAGIMYLYGGRETEIAHTVVNAIAIASGMICDGAKPSCAAKIAEAVEAGLLGMQMQRNGSEFYGGDGIVVKGVENTIRNIGTLGSVGMKGTDQTIIELMIGEGNPTD